MQPKWKRKDTDEVVKVIATGLIMAVVTELVSVVVTPALKRWAKKLRKQQKRRER